MKILPQLISDAEFNHPNCGNISNFEEISKKIIQIGRQKNDKSIKSILENFNPEISSGKKKIHSKHLNTII